MNVDFLINGEATGGAEGKTYDRLDPMTGELATRAAAATVEDATRAVDAADAAFQTWSKTGPGERRDLLMKAADAMEAKVEAFTAAVIAETGATGPWAGFNVMLAAGMIREAAAMTTQISGEAIPSNKPNTLAMAVRKPKGVCLGMHLGMRQSFLARVPSQWLLPAAIPSS